MKPVTATLRAPCEPEELFRWVDDLSHYPRWLDLVRRAEPLAAAADGAGVDGAGVDGAAPAWTVVLAAQIGPLRRSKQLTMVRTELDRGRRARFERREPDGRHHAAWVLQAEVRGLTPDEGAGSSAQAEAPARSELIMTMHYDGQWWAPLVERVLADQIDRARPRLLALVGG